MSITGVFMQQRGGLRYISLEGNEIFRDTVGYWKDVDDLSVVRTAYLAGDDGPLVPPREVQHVVRY